MRLRASSGLFLCALFAVAGAIAEARPSTIDVDDIQPGMKGYGLSVFRGTEPERFEAEVIDVLHNFRPDQDLILVRTKHPIVDHATTVAGMSGSPVYFEGKLAGAYAYGWPFGKDPVIGVTPIRDMLSEMRRPVRPGAFPGAEPVTPRRRARPRASATPSARPHETRLAGLPAYRGGPAGGALGPLSAYRKRFGRTPDPLGLRPAATPVMLGGFTDRAAHELESLLEPFDLVTLQAGGAARNRPGNKRPRFVDGGAIGVQLIRGDISATAVGTVTHVAGDKLVAFGHPMMNVGEVGLPTATARVLHVLASEARSFKIAEALDPLGTLTEDRQSAIVVDQGLRAATVPVTLRLHGLEGASRTEWKVEVASHRMLTPLLTFAAFANALQAAASDQTDVVYRAVSRITVEGQPPVELVDHGYLESGPGDARALAGLRLFQVMEAAYGNPFEPSRVTAVDLDLFVEFSRNVVQILDAAVVSDEVDPGSTVTVYVTTRRLDEPPRVRRIPIKIPERTAGEKIDIVIQAGNDVREDLPEPTSLADLLDAVQAGYPATSLVTSLALPTRGLRFRGHVVRALPASALDALQLANDSGSSHPFVTEVREVTDVGTVLVGSAKLKIQVRKVPRGGR